MSVDTTDTRPPRPKVITIDIKDCWVDVDAEFGEVPALDKEAVREKMEKVLNDIESDWGAV